MNETSTTSCLAITEKRPHRPGGCVGIFFQLFDWNRRFYKKKLFLKKLLPPARAKQSSNKFGKDEKMPKTKPVLVADENSGGFPNVKKNGNRSDGPEQKHEMRAAGLVARLMGLEYLPAVHRDKQKKASNSGATCDVKEEKYVNNHNASNGEVLNLEKGVSKVEFRPQKLQKTGQFEKRAVTRFGADALQIRNVLSRARKHHHPKLSSPVKSPRISSSRNVSRASRLIDAATRILEPGLQATNRAKCALAYSSSLNYNSKNKALVDGTGLGVMSPDLVKIQQQNDVNYNLGVDKSLMGQTSCKNCGNLLDVVDYRPTVEEQQPFVCPFSVVNASSPGFEGIKPRPPLSPSEQEKGAVYQINQVQLSTAAEKLDNTRSRSEPTSDRKPVSSEGQMPRQLQSQQCRPPKDEASSFAFRNRTEARGEMSVSRSRIPPRAKLNNLQSRTSSAADASTGAKDFVALNRSLGGWTRPRVSTKAYNYMVDTDRQFCSRRDDSLSQLRSPVRKRRTENVNAQLGSNELVNSKSLRHKNVKCEFMSGKEMETNARTADRPCIKTRLSSQREGRDRANGNKDDNVLSFTFNSPLRHKNFMSSGLNELSDHMDKNGNRANGNKDDNVLSFTFNSPLRHKNFTSGLNELRDHLDKDSSSQRNLPLDKDYGKTSLQIQLPLRGDNLGALLEQKLKELTSQEEDELTTGGYAPKRSNAMILHELISTLTAQQPFSPDCRVSNAQTSSQTEGRIGQTPVRYLNDGDHLSPGSVLEARFSNDSCFSSSLDDSSGRRLIYDSVDCLCDQLQPIETDVDLLDSATSTNDGWTGSKMLTELLNHISRILQYADGGLSGSKLAYVEEVILNAELLFESAHPYNSDRMSSFLIGPFLYELETLAGAIWTNFFTCPGFEGSKDGKVVRRFIFDCVIECLDLKYNRYCNCGFKAWRRLHLCMNAETLIEEVGNEVRRWTNLAGMIAEEMIEWEMSHSLGKWNDFEIEAFEIGAYIDWDILEVLVDEIVIDLLDCR